jgi:hypothetical protein
MLTKNIEIIQQSVIEEIETAELGKKLTILFDKLSTYSDSILLQQLTQLRASLNQVITSSTEGEVQSAAHDVLVELAKCHPLNNEDPVSLAPLKEIPNNRKLAMASGHQMDMLVLLSALQQGHRTNCLTAQPYSTIEWDYLITALTTACTNGTIPGKASVLSAYKNELLKEIKQLSYMQYSEIIAVVVLLLQFLKVVRKLHQHYHNNITLPPRDFFECNTASFLIIALVAGLARVFPGADDKSATPHQRLPRDLSIFQIAPDNTDNNTVPMMGSN